MALVDLLRVKALVALRQGHCQESGEILEEALMLARAIGYPYGEIKALFVAGQRYTRLYEQELARQSWQEALTICSRLGERLYAGRMEEALAKPFPVSTTQRPPI